MKKNLFIHWDNIAYLERFFKKPFNGRFHLNKPAGGLWASPIGSNHSWRKYAESFRGEEHFKKSFTFSLKDSARVLIIDSREDIKKIPIIKHDLDDLSLKFDFQKLVKKYDAIFLTEKGERRTRHHHPMSFYGWDCESILVFNKDIIVPVELSKDYIL